jgi:hypothetical protein
VKRFSSLYALFLLLVTSISAYAGVTDGDLIAYRFSGGHEYVLFTKSQIDDPNGDSGPFGAGLLDTNYCLSAVGISPTYGLACNGTFGDPVEDYTCEEQAFTPNTSNTTWCLFSENPRSGGKAWAVKYVGGEIPTNDGESIVRCKGTDVFHPDYGCGATFPSAISIEDGYMKMGTTDGDALFDGDCAEIAHHGRMVVDDVTMKLYICTAAGWKSTDLN